MYGFFVNEEKLQNVIYNVPDLPILFGKLELKDIPNHTIGGHWHKDLEFVIVLEGNVAISVNGTSNHLYAGMGMVINSNQVHFLTLTNAENCILLSILISPFLLTSSGEFYTRYMNIDCFDSILLDAEESWQADVIDDLKKLFDSCKRQDKCYDLFIKGLFYQIWARLCQNISSDFSVPKKYSVKSDCLKQMLSFIHDNYKRQISLQEICQSGAVSKSVCCRIFHEFLLQTPFSYLMQYRIEKSLDYLQNTNLNISEIAYETGFAGASYYAEVFRKYYQISPREYRRQVMGNSLA